MEFDETEKNAIAHFFDCPFEQLEDLFKVIGGLTEQFVRNALSALEKEIKDIAGFCSPTYDKNLIIVSFTDGTRISYHVGGQQAIMFKIPIFLPPGTPLEAINCSMTS